MQSAGLLDPFPLWTLFPATVAIALLAVEVGVRLARWRKAKVDEPEAPPAGIVAATLGLLAFMSAFTFGLAASRFDARRQLVLQEANAIQTAYLRSYLLPEPIRSEMRISLHEYVEARLLGTKRETLNQAITKSEELHKQMWTAVVALAEKERSAVTSLYIQSLNQIIDLHNQRLAAVRNRVPSAIWMVLYLLLILGMAAVGYQEAMASKRRSIAILMLVLGFSSVLFLIADLDRPGQGWFQVNQEAMVDLQRSIQE